MSEWILDLINRNKYAEVRNMLIEMNVVDIAQIVEEIDKDKLLILFRILPKEMAAGVFSYIPSELQEFIVESITDKEIKNIIDTLFLDDAVDFLEEMPANVVKRVLRNTDPETRKLINQFLNYPEDSVGSIMTIEFVDLKKEMTVREAIQHVKETGVDKETIDNCYVLDNNRILEGVISMSTPFNSEGYAISPSSVHRISPPMERKKKTILLSPWYESLSNPFSNTPFPNNPLNI